MQNNNYYNMFSQVSQSIGLESHSCGFATSRTGRCVVVSKNPRTLLLDSDRHTVCDVIHYTGNYVSCQGPLVDWTAMQQQKHCTTRSVIVMIIFVFVFSFIRHVMVVCFNFLYHHRSGSEVALQSLSPRWQSPPHHTCESVGNGRVV